MWFQLFHHLLSQQQHRALLQTVTVLQRNGLLSRLCFGLFGGQVLSVLATLCVEAATRLAQILSLEDVRKSEADVNKKSSDKMSLELADEGCSHIVDVLRALLQCTALYHSITPLVSSRVLMLSHSTVHPSVAAMRQHCDMLLTLRLKCGATMDKNTLSSANINSTEIGRMRPRIQEVLEICGLSMLRRLYNPPPTSLMIVTPYSGSSVAVVAVLETVKVVCGGGLEEGVGVLWRLLTTVCVQFDELTLHDVMDRLLVENKDEEVKLVSLLVEEFLCQWSTSSKMSVAFISWCLSRIVSEDKKQLFQDVLSSLKGEEKCQLEKIVSSLCFHFSESHTANMALFKTALAL